MPAAASNAATAAHGPIWTAVADLEPVSLSMACHASQNPDAPSRKAAVPARMDVTVFLAGERVAQRGASTEKCQCLSFALLTFLPIPSMMLSSVGSGSGM